MQGKNGHAEPVRNASCTNCGMAIGDPEKAVFDGESWYCDPRCHGQHINELSGNVPA